MNALAEAWAERRVKVGHASYLEVHSLANQLSNELQLAVRRGQLNVFDTFRKRERPYRDEDEKDLASGHVWLVVQSVDVWLLREGFPPALTKTALPTRPSAIANGSNVQLETQALPGPLFWNPLPEAAAWLASELGTPMDARALTDEIIRKGKPGTPKPTIIKAVMPRDGVQNPRSSPNGMSEARQEQWRDDPTRTWPESEYAAHAQS
ncbi:hypothetical protein, partial [Hydrogenophaga sp. MI9]|uniref:hypothetical protein n=1 Tax=Hydrogenophaga sp. MI9 TaxID=3453719 RepID=UPI003EEC4420